MELITQSRELLELGLLFGNSVGNQILVGSPGVCGRLFDQLAQIAPQESDALVDFRDGQRPIYHFAISAVCTSLVGSVRSSPGTLIAWARQPALLEDEARDLIDAGPVLQIREYEWAFGSHTQGIHFHDGEVRAHQRRQIDFVDNEEI